MQLSKYDIMGFIQSIRWGKIELSRYNLSRQDRRALTILLRRVDYLEEKEAKHEQPNGHAEAEISALKWAITYILLAVGEKEQSATSATEG